VRSVPRGAGAWRRGASGGGRRHVRRMQRRAAHRPTPASHLRRGEWGAVCGRTRQSSPRRAGGDRSKATPLAPNAEIGVGGAHVRVGALWRTTGGRAARRVPRGSEPTEIWREGVTCHDVAGECRPRPIYRWNRRSIGALHSGLAVPPSTSPAASCDLPRAEPEAISLPAPIQVSQMCPFARHTPQRALPQGPARERGRGAAAWR
jgi:hypothetical protein